MVRFQRLPQKLVRDSAKKGLLKCGAICKPIRLVINEAGPSIAKPRKAYSETAASTRACVSDDCCSPVAVAEPLCCSHLTEVLAVYKAEQCLLLDNIASAAQLTDIFQDVQDPYKEMCSEFTIQILQGQSWNLLSII